MALQTARYLVGQHRAQLRGEALVGSVRYLSEDHPRSWRAATLEEACDVNLLLEAFRFLVAGLVRVRVRRRRRASPVATCPPRWPRPLQECAEDLDKKEAAGMSPKEAWNVR